MVCAWLRPGVSGSKMLVWDQDGERGRVVGLERSGVG